MGWRGRALFARTVTTQTVNRIRVLDACLRLTRSPRCVHVYRWIEWVRNFYLRLINEKDKHRRWFRSLNSVPGPAGSNEKVVDANKPELKWLTDLQLVVERFIELQETPVPVAMNIDALTNESSRPWEKRGERLVLVCVFNSKAFRHVYLAAVYDA